MTICFYAVSKSYPNFAQNAQTDINLSVKKCPIKYLFLPGTNYYKIP